MTTFEGLTPGVWNVDPVHSNIAFRVRHMVVSKVHGNFAGVTGTITVAEDGTPTIEATIDATSITTNQAQRDEHLRSADFFDAANFPTFTFRSTAVRANGSDAEVDGELTIRGTTKPITLKGSFFGVQETGQAPVAGFEATATVNRQDFGVKFDSRLANGGAVVSDEVTILLDIEAVKAN